MLEPNATNAPRIAGVDPGGQGALVTLIPTGLGNLPVTPCAQYTIAEVFGPDVLKAQGAPWAAALPSLARLIAPLGIELAIVESVHSMAGEGHVGAFTFGLNYGSWLGLFAGLQIPVLTVPPDIWTAVMGVGPGKAEHRARAQALWPSQAGRFKPKGSDGIADAALLALFGTRFLPSSKRLMRDQDVKADETRGFIL